MSSDRSGLKSLAFGVATVMGRAKRDGLSIKPVTLRLPCPPEQRQENSRADRLYRLKQLRQNLTGLELGLAK